MKKHWLIRAMIDWDNGRHSNIPRCCTIWFYIRSYFGWPKFIVTFPYLYRFWCWVTPMRSEIHQYVRCPVCVLRRRFVEMHICDNECQGIVPTGRML